MSNAWRITLTLILALSAAGGLAAQIRATKPISEQNIFSEDDQRFDHSVALPADVLRMLLETEEAKSALEFARDSDRKNAAQLFRAVEVHLATPEEVDLIVLGITPMRGADNTWFWLVASAYVNPRIVLFSGGDSLELMTTRTDGYRDIRSLLSLASDTHMRLYHYHGRKYTIWKDKWIRDHR